jgi:hypothetical protein
VEVWICMLREETKPQLISSTNTLHNTGEAPALVFLIVASETNLCQR